MKRIRIALFTIPEIVLTNAIEFCVVVAPFFLCNR